MTGRGGFTHVALGRISTGVPTTDPFLFSSSHQLNQVGICHDVSSRHLTLPGRAILAVIGKTANRQYRAQSR